MPPISTADYHTGGEPFRIVLEGVPAPDGATILDRRAHAEQHLDDVRRFLVNEPRGHADMYGCFVTPPDDAGAAFGLVFFHKDGFSTACGHGTIAAATWAIESGMIQTSGKDAHFAIDVPSGRVSVEATVAGNRAVSVAFINVASWVSATELEVPGLDLKVDIAYGGAFYASARAADLGMRIDAASLPRLIDVGRRIKHAVDDHVSVAHPVDDRLSGCYGTIWWETVDPDPDHLVQRNVTIFADGEVDRSPCGSGTSARLALLDHSGDLPRGRGLEHRSIVDSVFRGAVLRDGEPVGGRPSVITRIEGTAHQTGRHTFTLDPSDPIGLGFQLR